MKFLSSLAATLLVLSGAAFAQEEKQIGTVPNPNGILSSVDLNSIEPVLNQAGFYTERQVINLGAGPRAGQKEVLLASVHGFVLILEERVCDGLGNRKKCAGLLMQALLVNAKASQRQIANYNLSSPAIRANLVDGSVLLDRYLIADHGITRGSLAINVAVLASAVGNWEADTSSSTSNSLVGVSFDPLIDPMAGIETHSSDLVRLPFELNDFVANALPKTTETFGHE